MASAIVRSCWKGFVDGAHAEAFYQKRARQPAGVDPHRDALCSVGRTARSRRRRRGRVAWIVNSAASSCTRIRFSVATSTIRTSCASI